METFFLIILSKKKKKEFYQLTGKNEVPKMYLHVFITQFPPFIAQKIAIRFLVVCSYLG